MSSKKSLCVAAVAMATKALVPKLSVSLWRCNTWTRPGLFWSACLPSTDSCVLEGQRGPLSHTHISLLLFAQVGQDALSFSLLPLSLCLACLLLPLSLSIYLSFSLASLLSHRDLWSNWSSRLHKETQIVFHLQPVTSCALCTFVLPLSTENV